MPVMDKDSADSLMDDIDAMARATYTWVRQQAFEQRFIGLPISAADESDLAAGFLAGLTVRLRLAHTESVLVAYAYALMRGERQQAVSVAQELLSKGGGFVASRSGYTHGLNAARELLSNKELEESLRLHRVTCREVSFKQH